MSGVGFVLFVLVNKMFSKTLKKDNVKYSDFIATMSFCLAFYVIFAILDCLRIN